MTDVMQRVQRLSESHRRLLRLRLMQQGRAQEARLVVYVIPHQPQGLTGQALRTFLSELVPEYMVPNQWVFVDAWPVTSRGKVDRKALQAMACSTPDPVRGPAPHNDCERAVAAIWEEVLGVRSVGLHDNFFDLGGHSLLLPTVLTRVRALAGRELSMVELFRYPTVQTLAAAIAGPQEAGGEGTGIGRLKDSRDAGVRRMTQRRAKQMASRSE